MGGYFQNGIGGSHIGGVLADYFERQGKLKADEDDKAAHLAFTRGAADYIDQRMAPPPSPMVEPQNAMPPFMPAAGPELPPEMKLPGPGDSADEMLGVGDLAQLYRMGAENYSPRNEDALKQLADIISGQGKLDYLNRQYELKGDLEDRKTKNREGLEGTKHGYRVTEGEGRHQNALILANIRANTQERLARLRKTSASGDLQHMLDVYDEEKEKILDDLAELEHARPLPPDPDEYSLMGDKLYDLELKKWEHTQKSLEASLRQTEGFRARAFSKGAKSREAPPPAAPTIGGASGGASPAGPAPARSTAAPVPPTAQSSDAEIGAYLKANGYASDPATIGQYRRNKGW